MMERNFFIFVSGIPRRTFAKSVNIFFANLGFHTFVVSQYLEISPSEWPIDSGYCLMGTRSKQAFETLLNHSHFEFQGRQLKVQPQLTGLQLYKLNRSYNKRRILLKRVPGYISTEEIKRCLEKHFGRISEFFELKSEMSYYHQIDENRKNKTFSVMFETIISDMIQGSIELEVSPGVYVHAERFSLKKKTFQKQNQLGTGNRQASSKKESSRVDSTIGALSSQFQTKTESSTTRNQTSVVRQSLSLRQIAIALPENRRARSSGRVPRSSQGCCRSQIVDDLLAASHHCKPSSKVYRLIRCEKFEYFSAFELGNTWTAKTNFKYNTDRSIRYLVPLARSANLRPQSQNN